MTKEKINGKLNQWAWVFPVMAAIIISLFGSILGDKTETVEENRQRLNSFEPRLSVVENEIKNHNKNIESINSGIKDIQTDVKTLLQRK